MCRIFRVVAMVSFKPNEPLGRYKFGWEFLGRRGEKGPDATLDDASR
jgi:hypothetical protein